MKGLTIKCKTEAGERALRAAMEANQKAPFAQRAMYRQTYAETVLSEKPFTWRMEHRQQRLEAIIPPTSMFPPVEIALREYGALNTVDYEVAFDE